MNKGFFITFEGGEGSGKSTLAKMLYEHAKSNNVDVVLCNDPSSSDNDNGEFKMMRKLLVNDKYDLSKSCELMMYLASRAQLVDKIIKPALKESKLVICDRFLDSTTIYQGYMRGHSLVDIANFNKVVCKDVFPDITILCDVDAKIGLKRSKKKLKDQKLDESKWEALGLHFHQEVNKWFRQIALANSERFKILDSTNMTIDEMFKEIINEE